MSNYIQSGELTASRIDGNKSLLKCSGKARNEIALCAEAGKPAGRTKLFNLHLAVDVDSIYTDIKYHHYVVWDDNVTENKLWWAYRH